MSTQTQNAPTKAQNERIRKSAATEIRSAIAEQARQAIRAGAALFAARATFGVAEQDEWRRWAVNVSGKSYKTCQSYIAVFEAHSALPKATQKTTAGWTFEALQGLAATPKESRVAVVKESGTMPTVETVREVRDRVVVVDPAEQKKKEQRQRKNAAEKTLTLAAEIRPAFQKILRMSSQAEVAIAAVKLAGAYKGQDVAAAMQLLVKNAQKAEQQRQQKAEKAAAELAAGR